MRMQCCVLILLSTSLLACAQNYTLSVTRQEDVDPMNELILNCTGGEVLVTIFRNAASYRVGMTPLTLTVNKSLEGEYACGDRVNNMSPSLQLVGEQ